MEEVVQMHQEAEKLLGRQSGEVGELRKVVDDYISTQTTTSSTSTQTVEPEDDIDYFTDPQGAVNRAIENHPKIREASSILSSTKSKRHCLRFKLNIQTCKQYLVTLSLQNGLKHLRLGLSCL